jgi:protein FAM50
VQKIRRMEKKREEDKRKMEELKKKTAEGASGLLQFGQGTSEVLNLLVHPFKAQ